MHGYNRNDVEARLINALQSAVNHNERVVRIIHGQGKHSDVFPVIKSFVRSWLEVSLFALEHVETVFRGEDGSPYTTPNAGETVLILRGIADINHQIQELSWDEEEKAQARKNAKGMRAQRLRKARRRGPK